MKHTKLLIPVLLLMFVLAACSPQVVPQPGAPEETPVVSEPMPPTGDLPAGVKQPARSSLSAWESQ
jgi:hypothetical protein